MWARSTIGRLAARHCSLSNSSGRLSTECLAPVGNRCAVIVPRGLLHSILLRHSSKVLYDRLLCLSSTHSLLLVLSDRRAAMKTFR